MKNILIILFFFSFQVFAQNETKFYFIFNDSKLSVNDIKKKINFLLEHSDAKKISFELLHYSLNAEIPESWVFQKNQVSYKPSKIGCEFNICDKITNIIELTKTEKSRLYIAGNLIDCSSGIETVSLPNKDESTIIDKIDEELKRIKDLKKNQCVYFFFNSSSTIEKPSLRFDPDILTLKESDKVTLQPIVTGNIKSYIWTPSTGLSCSDCKNPQVTINESRNYTLTIKDSLECNTLSSNLQINLEKNCVCEKELSKIEIMFGKLPIKKFEAPNPNVKVLWEWRIISNQSGGYVFDLVTNSSCAKKYRLKVLRQNGGVIYDEYYDKEQVDKRSHFPYHANYPDKFVFRVDLSRYETYNLIEDVENEPYFIIEITSIDDNGEECLNKKYRSPKLRPTKCS
jgi:hypothetical protein